MKADLAAALIMLAIVTAPPRVATAAQTGNAPSNPEQGPASREPRSYREALDQWESQAGAALAAGLPGVQPGFDDSGWPEMRLPAYWESGPLPGFDGLVWFRKTVEIPTSWTGRDVLLELGPIDDADRTWVNGVEVGSHLGPDQWNVPRNYAVEAGILRPGRNVIAVLVLDTRRDGGFHGQPDQMRLGPVGVGTPDAIPLAGPWRYRVGARLGPRPEPPGRQGKEQDLDIVYDEDRVPRYALPPLLVTAEGRPVTTPEEWRTVRRPQILSLFSNLIYGRVPEPEIPIETTFEVVRSDPRFMDGRATRKEVRIRFASDNGAVEMLVLVFVPNGVQDPVPAFLMHSFDDTRSGSYDLHPAAPDRLRNGCPLGEMFQRGYGFVAVYQQALVGHNEVEFRSGIHPLFYHRGQSFPRAHEWGVLAAMAWGASRALDYLATDPAIDATRVAVMGHSKCGKAALWTAAQDERFAMAISAQSGCAGAALWRRKSGETLEKMVTRFPYWLCRNAGKFTGQEDDLPVDQHMLLACIAPRPVYIHSGQGDTWADPRGEYLSAYHASRVYELLGKKGLTSEVSPPVGTVLQDGTVGYHNRPGGHSIEPYDWQQFLNFADRHLRHRP
ncbi:MAG: hypothetical protein H7A47_04970 [Verrucomicrobiales bacterium]|nr:hypothetical protein [Verrucomicrobiales bacterium]